MSKCDRQKNSSRNHVRRYRKRLFESNESNAVHLNTSRSFDISEKALITGKGMMSLDEFEKWFNDITKKVFQKRQQVNRSNKLDLKEDFAMKKHEDEALMNLQRIDEAIALYEAEGEEALEEIEKSLTKDEFEVFMDEVEELLEDDEDDEGFEDEDDLERVDEMAYAKPKIAMEDIYCIPIATLKLFMLDFEKGENLGRLKKADEFKFIIELKSAYPGSGFIEESDIAHDKWEQYDVLVELFDKVHQRLMDFCRLSGNKNFMPYSFVLKKQSLSTNDTDILIRADTNEYNENRTADINIPYKKNIEKRVDNLLRKHKLSTIIHC